MKPSRATRRSERRGSAVGRVRRIGVPDRLQRWTTSRILQAIIELGDPEAPGQLQPSANVAPPGPRDAPPVRIRAETQARDPESPAASSPGRMAEPVFA